MSIRPLLLAALLFLVGCSEKPMLGQGDAIFDPKALNAQVGAVARRAEPGVLGVAVQEMKTREIWLFNAERRFPLQSVFKAALGAAVLAEVDAGRLSLDETITLKDTDLSTPFSPVADAWPGVQTYTVGDLLERAAGGGDNTAADVLMKRVGGPGALTAWLEGKKVQQFHIDRYERELQPEISGMASFRPAWKGNGAYVAALNSVPPAARQAATRAYLKDPRDTATPLGAARFLEALNDGELLSPASTARLLDILTHTQTGPGRLKAALPEGARLAHKTGTARTDLGMNPATNDIGIYTLKDGRRISVSVFLTGSTLDDAARDAIIADVGRIVLKAAEKAET